MRHATHSLSPKVAYLLFLFCALWVPAQAEVQRVKFEAQGNYLIVETLADDLIHLEYGRGAGPDSNSPIATSDMVCTKEDGLPETLCNTDYSGPTEFDRTEASVETKDIRLSIGDDLSLSLIDKTKGDLTLTTLRPADLDRVPKKLVGTRTAELDVYGLGQQFVDPGQTDIDWDGRVREGSSFGNVMAGFNGGANGNTQFPILYAVNGAGFENYGLFLDNTYKHKWDFSSASQWSVEISGGDLRLYVMTGPDLLDLRRDYMELVGHPLVPPKKMFGLWLSEYGYDNWGELEAKLQTLRENDFPLDGFVLDLQWFGGITPHSDHTRMGSLTFDTENFSDPEGKISGYRENECADIMLIEEAYVGRALPEHGDLHSRGCLAKARPGSAEPAYITANPWWGKGGMIDYTNEDCGAYVHDNKRRALIDKGVTGHWTDLGEPEMFNAESGYAVGDHAAAHNIFNFRWIRSIHEGYGRHGVSRRPFMMSRSGTAGIQRFGAAMWSGDIGSKLDNLDSHAANQKHMSFSGIDYYGSDIGGFHRGDIQQDPDRKREMYTQWFAAGMMLDAPGRPHTENLCNCKETAPDRIGDLQANRENARLRYRLIPYLYSLAHRAYRTGDPVMPPLVMYYQDDVNVRNRGQEKLVGRDLLTAVITGHGETRGNVYLPEGEWVDWHTNRRTSSDGVFKPVSLYPDGLFKLPLFARAGSIIPTAHVDEQTMCSEGRRKDGSVRNELGVRVFDFGPGAVQDSTFTLYEDDGRTVAYQQGEVRETPVTHTTAVAEGEAPRLVTVAIEVASGTYEGAPTSRNNVVELVTDAIATSVTLNGQGLQKFDDRNALNTADAGWMNASNNLVIAKSGVKDVSETKAFEFTLTAPLCTSDHDFVAVPGAGNGWDPSDPDRRLTSCIEKVWSGQIVLCNEEYKFAADGFWTTNWGCDGKQEGPNCSPLASGAGVYDVKFDEARPAEPMFTRIDEAASCSTGFRFICENGDTNIGTSVYVVGNVERLGSWDTTRAVKLEPDGPYPTWTREIGDLPSDLRIEWKCIKRLENPDYRVLEWEPGANNVLDHSNPTQVGAF